MLTILFLTVLGCNKAATPTASPVSPSEAPVARAEAVTDTYHGVEVADPYRWLENWEDPDVKSWSEGQNHAARAVLDDISGREVLEAEFTDLMGAKVITHYPVFEAGGRIFAGRHQPPRPQAFLVELSAMDADAEARVIFDPTAGDDDLMHMDWFVPSPDGTHVAISVSRAGTESGDVRILDVETLEQVDAILPRVNGGTAGGALAWAPDSSGFWYTRYPREGERDAADMNFYTQAWFHTLGSDDDRYELGKDFARIVEIDFEVHPSGAMLLTTQLGDGGQFSHHLRTTDGTYHELSVYGDQTVMVTFSEDGEALYAVSFADASRGRILKTPTADTSLENAKVFLDESEDTVVASFWSPPSLLEIDGSLLVIYQTGGPSTIRAFDMNGEPLTGPSLLDVSATGSMHRNSNGTVLFSNGSFTTPWRWATFDPATGETALIPLNQPHPADLSDIEVRREFAVSKDGTRVPVNILLPPGLTLDGSNPVILNGYGGYGVSLSPRFRATNKALLDRGVIVAVANLRGGGEYGESWHKQGNLTHKQNVFDDFYAAIQLLTENNYSTPENTAIIGGSNGGLLMGATLVQHPESVAAIVSSVGIYDMLRVELSPNGAFNVTEFGTVKDEAQFTALRAYSPYHNVTDATPYPPILFTTGANDPRVDPMQSRKMTARLQVAKATDAPVLLRTNLNAGHGGGAPLAERITLLTDQYAFLLAHLGVDIAATTDDSPSPQSPR
jgi:prolyl oligopeptidase